MAGPFAFGLGSWGPCACGCGGPTCQFLFCSATLTIANPTGSGTAAKGGLTVSGGVVTAVSLWSGGGGGSLGYLVAHPAVTISDVVGGSGSGATAVATVGEVVSLTLTNAGAGYNPASPPNVTIGAPGAGGTQATATATVGAGGSLTIALTDRGALYTTAAPTVTIDAPPPGGTRATATASASPGVVTSLVLTAGGGGYDDPQVPPSLNFTISCASWSYSFELALGKSGLTSATPLTAPAGQPAYCTWGGSTTQNINTGGPCGTINGVTIWATVGQFGPWSLAVNLGVAANSAGGYYSCPGACNSPPYPAAEIGYCLTPTPGTSSTHDSPFGGVMNLTCSGRPYSWSSTVDAYVYLTGCSSSQSALWYALGGGNCPTPDPTGSQPPVPFTFTLSEP